MKKQKEKMDSDEEVQELDAKSPEVVEKYEAAAEICNAVMSAVLEAVKPGAKIVNLCSLGDRLIKEKTAGVYTNEKKMEKGIAFPTCVSVNNIVGHFSPLSTETVALKEGDVVKVDLGVHIDGFIIQSAHTIVATDKPDDCITGKKADVVCAAHFAAEAALRLFKPGQSNSEITKVWSEIAPVFKCNVVEGVLSHQLKRFVIDGNNCVLSRETIDHKVNDVTFQPFDVFCFDIVMTTGEGIKLKEGQNKTTIFKRALGKTYLLKLATARAVLGEISSKFTIFPFSLRNFADEKKAKLGITEVLKHELIDPFPVLEEKKGEFVAQFKYTAIIGADGNVRKLTSQDLPFVKSDFEITDPKIQQLLNDGEEEEEGTAAPAEGEEKKD